MTEREVVRALRIPAPWVDADSAGEFFVAALTRWGNWIDFVESRAGEEAEALAKLAAAAREIGDLRCEPALAEAGRASGWTAEETANQEERRSLASFALLLGEGREPPPLPMAEKFVEIAADYFARRPWRDPRILAGTILFATTRLIDPDEPRPEAAPERILAMGFPPVKGDSEARVLLLRTGAPAFVICFSTLRPIPLLEEWLARRGLPGIVPLAQRSGSAKEVPRPLDDVELLTAAAMLNTLAVGVRGLGVDSVRLSMCGVDVAVGWPDSTSPPVRAKKIGRNDPCHCGSGRKYKKCHLLVDALPAPEDSRVRARPLGKGAAEFIVATDGKPVPEGGYDDCPICQAERDEERLRKMREHSRGTLH